MATTLKNLNVLCICYERKYDRLGVNGKPGFGLVLMVSWGEEHVM